MNKEIIDSRISKTNKKEFYNRGWTLVDLKLTEEVLSNALQGLIEMKRLSSKIDYPPRRIYYDHLFNKNLAAIEIPFNKRICNEKIKNLFKEANIGSLVGTLMNWDNPCCDLSRIFCMGNYKYRGNWHRDYESDLKTIQNNTNFRDVILVGIYLLPQKGFRILKKDYDFNGSKSIVLDEKLDKQIRKFPFPLSPPIESFDVIDGKIGTALFFDPFLLHQGSNYSERLDFHMKFINSNEKINFKNDFQDFSVIEILQENYELSSNNFKNDINMRNIPNDKRSTLFQRLSNTIDYRTCLRRFLKIRSLKNNKNYKIIKRNGWKLDLLSNTQYQN